MIHFQPREKILVQKVRSIKIEFFWPAGGRASPPSINARAPQSSSSTSQLCRFVWSLNGSKHTHQSSAPMFLHREGRSPSHRESPALLSHFRRDPVCCCMSVCSLSPSRRPCPPAASSERTRPPSSRASPLWTPRTPTPVRDPRTAGYPLTLGSSHAVGSCDLVTSWKWSVLNMATLTWLFSPIFASNFLTPSLVTPGGRQEHHHSQLCNPSSLHRAACGSKA